jgi:hypothetical protein
MRIRTPARGIVITALFTLAPGTRSKPRSSRYRSSRTIRFGRSRCRTGGYLDRWAACASMRATTCSP